MLVDCKHPLGYSPQKPRPKHLQSASIEEQDAFKKKVAELIKSIRETHPDKQVELWVQDEGRVGLKPEIRRIWAARGKRPIILQKRGYKWVYVYTFVEPLPGKTDFFGSGSTPHALIKFSTLFLIVMGYEQVKIVLMHCFIFREGQRFSHKST